MRTQRRSEIGILRALGATRRQIRWLFLGESAVTGLIGSLGGLSFNMNQVLSGALILLSLAMLAILARRPAAPGALSAPASGAAPDVPGSAPTA